MNPYPLHAYLNVIASSSDSSPRLHPAWVVLVAVTVCMMASSGLRSVFGVYIQPLEAAFGWTRGALSGVAAISLLLLGAAGPFAGRLADRWGPRRIIALSLIMLGGGAIGTAAVHALWQLYVTTGLLMGIGAGGLGLATGSVIATRWFEARRGLAIGIAAGGMSAGQLVVIPLAAALMVWFGWRASFSWLGLAVLAIVLPVALWFVRDDPLDRGVRPYGATGATAAPTTDARRSRRVGVVEAAQHPQFWLLMGTFFVCG